MSGSVQLRGGSSSIAVDPDLLDLVALRLTALARAVDSRVTGPLAAAGRPGLASVLDPVGYAEVLARSVAALALAAAVVAECLGLAGTIRAAAETYRQADGVLDRLRPLGRAMEALPTAAGDLLRRKPGRILIDDPELADVGVQSLTVIALAPFGPLMLRPAASVLLAAGLSRLYRHTPASVTERRGAPTTDGAGAPRSTADLLREVAVREDDDAGGGAVDVRILDGPAGRRVVVDIGGTTAWDLDPLHPSRQASNFATNLDALAGRRSAISEGVRLALRREAVSASTPIMLVGHSQGGLVAAELADELNRDREFRVTHVVTAGSPIGLSGLPSSISVLSLENRGDPVPELDGADNPDRRHWLTATVAHGTPDVLGRHSINSYVAGAHDFDVDPDSAVKDWRFGAVSFLDAYSVHTVVFEIGRN